VRFVAPTRPVILSTGTAAAEGSGVVLSGNGGMAGSGIMDGAAPAPPRTAPSPCRPRSVSSTVPAETPAAHSNPPSVAVGGPVGTPEGVRGGTGDGPGRNPGSPGAATGGGAARPRADGGHPGHGTIDLTADQLKAAPAFTFARSRRVQ